MKKILYVQTSGVDTPERTYAPFILGMTAVNMDIEATVYFVMKGVTIVRKGEAEKVRMGEFPSLKEIMDQAIEAGVRMFTCEQSCQLFGIPKGQFIDQTTISGAATLNDLSLEADTVLCF